MANPVGEDSWLAYVEEETRHVKDLEGRVKIIELFKSATSAEPGSMRIWLAYCEYFWSLFTDCQSSEAGWSIEEQQLGQQLFSFDSALRLWSDGYESVRYRLNDSHQFWNRWISIEQEQLARTRTPFGVQRISHLFRDRLQVPHATWDETSQMFSGFLSEYNNAAYESEFKEVTAMAQGAKAAYSDREPRELKLRRAERSGDVEEQKAVMREYLDWETAQTEESQNNPTLPVALGLALYSRALAGIFTADEEIWANYIVYVSSLHTISKTSTLQYNIPDLLGVHQRAVSHCPWSGMLWGRYILGAEEAGLTFQDVEHIKHAATNTKALDKNGMTGVIDMYAAWCGYLKRTAMNPSAHEDAVDIADVGLSVALEDVQLWGERLYKKEYKGDPHYRIERILVQYLTEKKGEVDAARRVWNRAAQKSLLANSYDFWLNYYLWEMMIFSSQPRPRSPTPAGGVRALRVPTLATEVLSRALQQETLDWPERIMEVYSQHLNDYEHAETLRKGLDAIHKARKAVAQRRQHEQAKAAAAYAAQVEAQQQQARSITEETAAMQLHGSPSSSKRKRDEVSDELENHASKRSKNADSHGSQPANTEETLKRDRENTSVLVTNLPVDVTLTAVRKYFKEYGHIVNAIVEKEKDGGSASALIEFESPEEMQSALLRDNKYLGSSQINVKAATGLTIYVSNYPPTADENYIRNLFKDCGEIFNIRFPSLKFDTRRRFCYLSFRDAEAAEKATQMNGKPLEGGKYTLQSKYSDPLHKKKRDGAVAEGRELHLKNVDFKLTAQDLRKVLEKYGDVQSVRINKNLSGQSKGTAFATFASKEQAEKAVELNKTKLGYRVVDVELSRETKFKPVARSTRETSTDGDVAMEGTDSSGSGPSSREIQDRTMALLNVPDTVNDARLRALAEEHGNIVKLVLQPNHQGAIIEYADVNTTGRAMLHLDGYEIVPGRKLRTGSVQELMRQKGETRVDKLMAPPQSIRRPGPNTAGGRGPKKALGFVKKTTTTAESTSAEGAATNGTGPGKPKSNADFKAMFLGGKSG